ncbi:MAG: dUTP pyrophosphatase [Proteobacteria bacterium]|nr:dUTP pyrophosphatase [Pseudomonadota bacterium]
MSLPKRAHATDAGLDLTLMKVVEKRENLFFFDTGVSVEVPEGYYTELYPRSSIYKVDFIMANSVGIIDTGYRGILYLPMRYVGNGNGRDEAEKLIGHRVGQLVLRKLEPFHIQIVGDLSESERGGKGFGSSGS